MVSILVNHFEELSLPLETFDLSKNIIIALYETGNASNIITGVLYNYNEQKVTFWREDNGEMDAYIENNELIIRFKSYVTGNFTLRATTDGGNKPQTIDTEYTIFDSSKNPSSIIYNITNTEILNRLKNKQNYTASLNMTVNTEKEVLTDNMFNFRVIVSNNEYTSLVDEITDDNLIEMLYYGEISDIISSVNTVNPVKVDFTYDEDYPLKIIITGEMIKSEDILESNITYDNLVLYENTGEELSDFQVHHLTPINNIADNNTDTTANINLNPYEYSNIFVLSDFKDINNTEVDFEDENILDDETGATYGNTDTEIVRGVEINIPVIEADSVTIHAILRTDERKTGQRSIIIDPINTPTDIKIGGESDLWGLQIKDMENLEDWELSLRIINNNNNTANITLGDISLTYYTNTIEDNTEKIYIEDNNLDWYNIILTNMEIPTGLNTDTKQFEIEGSDVNTAYLQNIRDKTIKIFFEINNCDLTEANKTLESIARLFYNERDSNDWPKLKSFRASSYPGKEWKYIVTKEMDTEIIPGGYSCSIELLVPSGTYISTDEIVTGAIGYNEGLCKVNPTIKITNISSEISITETVSNQKFIIRPENYQSDDIITIDCENRIITRENPSEDETEDWSSYCDLDNDWFSINKEYNFNESGCKLVSVSYFEKG